MNKINPEYQRWLDILSGLPGLGLAEQQAEILDRQKRGDLVQVNEVWYERVDLSDEAAAAVRRAVQAKDEARPHDDEETSDVVFVVEAAGVGAIFAASTDQGARTWIRDEGTSTYGAGNLAITSLAVVRG